jgi:hypothetical protein
LRLTTVNELLTQKAIEKRASELGISVTEDEIDQAVDAFKQAYAFDSDDIFEQTLEGYGQTLEGFRDTQALALLKQKLLLADLTVDTPTDEEVLETVAQYAASYQSADEEEASADADASADESAADVAADSADATTAGHTVKHSYLFAINVTGDEATLADLEKVQQIKDDFTQTDMDIQTFLALIELYCDVDSVTETSGAMGWDIDTSDYSTAYATQLAKTDVGATSEVFNDGTMECFIWVDQGYFLPYAQSDLDALDLSAMPDSLHEYFQDQTLYQKRSELSTSYFQSLVDALDIVLYPMPASVEYNVDMSAYAVDTTDDADVDTDTDSDTTQNAEGVTSASSSTEAQNQQEGDDQ